MILPSSQVPTAYRQIVARARGSPACTTYLFVAPDVDALCAARLLSALLKTDDVAHQTVPVGSWAQLAQEAQQLRDEDIRNLVLVNLGATADLYALFGPGDPSSGQGGLDFPPSCMIHVVDSHRPVALANLFTWSDYARAVFDPRRVRALGAAGGGAGAAARARLAPLPEEELCVVVWDEVREKAIEGDDGGEVEDPWKRERQAFEELEVRLVPPRGLRRSLSRTAD